MANEIIDIPGYTNENKAIQVATIVGIIALLAGIYYGVKTGRKFWYYVLLLLVLVPSARLLGTMATLKAE